MPILKSITADNGIALTYHRPVKIEVDIVTGAVRASINSYASEAIFLAGMPPAWNWPVAIPLASLAGADIIGAAETALIGIPDSPFYQGGIVSDESQSLDAAKARKLAALKDACRAQIVAGFQSSALGTAHTYPAKELDQTNLVGSVVASLIAGADTTWSTPFWCADAEGTWGFAMHTAAQIQQVGIDSKASILAALSKNESLAGAVAAANTTDQVEAVSWS